MTCYLHHSLNASSAAAPCEMQAISHEAGEAWAKRVGPRAALSAASLCLGGGLVAAGIALDMHSLPLLCASYGLLTGTGLGIAFTSPRQVRGLSSTCEMEHVMHRGELCFPSPSILTTMYFLPLLCAGYGLLTGTGTESSSAIPRQVPVSDCIRPLYALFQRFVPSLPRPHMTNK